MNIVAGDEIYGLITSIAWRGGGVRDRQGRGTGAHAAPGPSSRGEIPLSALTAWQAFVPDVSPRGPARVDPRRSRRGRQFCGSTGEALRRGNYCHLLGG